MSPAVAGGFFTSKSPGKPYFLILKRTVLTFLPVSFIRCLQLLLLLLSFQAIEISFYSSFVIIVVFKVA